MYAKQNQPPTLGSLFAGIGGFDLGFEKAGFRTLWQVELDPINRAVLADRFPHTRQFADIRECGSKNLERVDVVTGGFPCQDVSVMGKRRGLAGARTGLFFEACRILEEIQPAWLVLENVFGLLSSHDGEDFQAVIKTLAELGYLGFWRVLDARYFGVPQSRRRVFMVAGLGRYPPIELLADASAMAVVPGSTVSDERLSEADTWAANTLCTKTTCCQIGLNEVLIAYENGWDQMVERGRMSEADGVCLGLDEANFKEAWAAGNAVVPQVAQWIGQYLMSVCAPCREEPR